MSTLVLIMVWCPQRTNHYLRQCWSKSWYQYDVTVPGGFPHLHDGDNSTNDYSVVICVNSMELHVAVVYFLQIYRYEIFHRQSVTSPTMALLSVACKTDKSWFAPPKPDISVLGALSQRRSKTRTKDNIRNVTSNLKLLRRLYPCEVNTN